MQINLTPIESMALTADNAHDITRRINYQLQHKSPVEQYVLGEKTNGEWERVRGSLIYQKTGEAVKDDRAVVTIDFLTEDQRPGQVSCMLDTDKGARVDFLHVNGRPTVYISAQDTNYENVNPLFMVKQLLVGKNE